jgi:hypothetical protein
MDRQSVRMATQKTKDSALNTLPADFAHRTLKNPVCNYCSADCNNCETSARRKDKAFSAVTLPSIRETRVHPRARANLGSVGLFDWSKDHGRVVNAMAAMLSFGRRNHCTLVFDSSLYRITITKRLKNPAESRIFRISYSLFPSSPPDLWSDVSP